MPERDKILVEVCVDSIAGALAAAEGNADRIEVCSALSEGGTTPSAGMVAKVMEDLHAPDKANALSVFVRNETLRCFSHVPALQL